MAVYGLIPGRAALRGDGLAEYTGGEVFASSYDIGPPIDRILQDAANYYVLGYWPVGAPKQLASRRGEGGHARARGSTRRKFR